MCENCKFYNNGKNPSPCESCFEKVDGHLRMVFYTPNLIGKEIKIKLQSGKDTLIIERALITSIDDFTIKADLMTVLEDKIQNL